MSKGKIERRDFIKICSTAALGSTFVTPGTNFFHPKITDNREFKLLSPRWIIYDNGSFDLISNEIVLKNCRPSIDDQTLTPRNVFLGDSPKGNRIVYELPRGFVMLDLQTYEDSLAIGVEFSGFTATPRWFFPISQAQVFGAHSFFRQGYGTGGPTGIFDLHLSNRKINNNGIWQNWSIDSYLTSALIGEKETIAIGNISHNNFLQRSTLYCHSHYHRLLDKNISGRKIFFEAAILLNQTKIEKEYIKIPNLYFFTGNKPFETLQALAHKTAIQSNARQISETSYHWISKWDEKEKYSYYLLKKEIDFLVKTKPSLPIKTLTINKGYCKIGDWLEPNILWPGGLDKSAREIYKHGYRAGIWVAPFVVEKDSKIFKRHPNWLIKNYNGDLISEKADDNRYYYTLDASHNGVKKYLKKVFNSLRKMGFISYNLAYLEWGIKDSYNVKKSSSKNSSLQDFKEILSIIRDEIGHGSLIIADHTSYSSVIGFADIVKLNFNRYKGWEENKIDSIIRETYLSQYFNNILWQNNPGELELSNNQFTRDEKISLSLWFSFLGGTVGTSDNFTEWTNQQLNFFRFLEPAERFNNARLPFWPSEKEIKIAVRSYDTPSGWSVLAFNDKNTSVNKIFQLKDIINLDNAFIFDWKPGYSNTFGFTNKIKINLLPHQSQLFWISKNNIHPPTNLTIGGKLQKI